MENLTGKQLGPYQVVSPLGEGGMAAVYKAYQPGMERYVALKILPQHLAKDPQFVGRFQQEAKLLANLQHPHILPVFDYGEFGGYTYIVMPLVESGTLADLLRGNPLPLDQANRIISQVGDALDYAHTQGLIHRDIKPSNILVDERGNCLLTDFGIAKIFEGTAQFTQTGGIIGTPAYMSPEQGKGAKVDSRSDIYSLGIVLYEMLTGRVPFDAETPIAIVYKHIQDPLPLPRSLNPGLPDAVQGVILKSLAKEPEERYSRAGDMVRALQTAVTASQTGQTVLDTDPKIAPDGRSQTRRLLPIGAAALLLGAVGIICLGVFLSGRLGLGGTVTPTTVADRPSPTITTPQSTEPPIPTETETEPPPSPSPTLTVPAPATPTPVVLIVTATSPPQETVENHLAADLIAYGVQSGDVWSILLVSSAGDSRRFLPGAPTNNLVPNFSPDGNTIAYRARDGATWQIFTQWVDGSNFRQITSPPGSNYEPNYSPDGSRFAFISDRDGNKELYLMNVDGSSQTRLTNNPGLDDDPSWSPDGEWIVFESTVNGRADIYRIRPNGNDLTRLTSARDWNATPAWSPDGEWIAFVSRSDGQEHIWIMRTDGTDQRRLTASGTINQRPAWSPDGRQIAYTSNRGGGATEIWIMNADGSNPRQLTNEAGAYDAAWSRYSAEVVTVEQTPKPPSCPLANGQQVHAAESARPWTQPDVTAGLSNNALPTGQVIYVIGGPEWGPIRLDVDISGWWWEVSADPGGSSLGWLWEGRLVECQ